MSRPTVVVFVKGGLVQDIAIDGEVRVIVLDFDVDSVDEDTHFFEGDPCTSWVEEGPTKGAEDFAIEARFTVDDDEGCPVGDPDCLSRADECHDACEPLTVEG